MSKTSPRVLIYDIETSLQTAAIFDLKYNDYISQESLLTERYVISICWMWLGEKKVHSVSVLDDPKRFARNPSDDKHVLEVFHKVLSEADCIVAHNGDAFDFRYLKTRMLVNNLPALPPISSIDTYKIAKSQFRFNANRLDYIGKYLGLGGKKSTPKGLWLDVLRGSKQAIKTMVEYNKRDVTLLKDVFFRLRAYIPNYINRELFGEVGCPRCGSSKIQSRGYHRAISRVYRRWQCQSCSGWFKSTKAEPGSTKFRIL
jgi:DNA polymerase elongation subunit (family B)